MERIPGERVCGVQNGHVPTVQNPLLDDIQKNVEMVGLKLGSHFRGRLPPLKIILGVFFNDSFGDLEFPTQAGQKIQWAFPLGGVLG